MHPRLTSVLAVLIGLSITGAASDAIAKKRTPERAQQPVIQAAPPNPALPLKPGDFTWYADRAVQGPVEMLISVSQQRAYVFQSGELIGFATVSSGKNGTATGRFQILEKRKMYRSARYDNAPMPFMMRLNWFGVAMHGGHNPGYPASHGCVRLPLAFAEKLFSTASVGSFVFITQEAPRSPGKALEIARLNYATAMPSYRLPNGTQSAATYAEKDFPNRNVMAASYAQQEAPPPPPERPRKAKRSFWDRIGDIF